MDSSRVGGVVFFTPIPQRPQYQAAPEAAAGAFRLSCSPDPYHRSSGYPAAV